MYFLTHIVIYILQEHLKNSDFTQQVPHTAIERNTKLQVLIPENYTFCVRARGDQERNKKGKYHGESSIYMYTLEIGYSIGSTRIYTYSFKRVIVYNIARRYYTRVFKNSISPIYTIIFQRRINIHLIHAKVD